MYVAGGGAGKGDYSSMKGCFANANRGGVESSVQLEEHWCWHDDSWTSVEGKAEGMVVPHAVEQFGEFGDVLEPRSTGGEDDVSNIDDTSLELPVDVMVKHAEAMMKVVPNPLHADGSPLCKGTNSCSGGTSNETYSHVQLGNVELDTIDIAGHPINVDEVAIDVFEGVH